jgi:hypothetical protein
VGGNDGPTAFNEVTYEETEKLRLAWLLKALDAQRLLMINASTGRTLIDDYINDEYVGRHEQLKRVLSRAEQELERTRMRVTNQIRTS